LKFIPQKFLEQIEDDDILELGQEESLTCYLEPTHNNNDSNDSSEMENKSQSRKAKENKFSFIQSNNQSGRLFLLIISESNSEVKQINRKQAGF
jgi:hypothetical protein